MREAAGKPPMPPIKGAIDVEGVTFSYHHDQPVLRNVNMIVNPGDTVGIVGLTGAGKTTLMMLLARFYDPNKGKVRVDGYDIRTIQLDTLREQIGIVFQDPFLFSASLADNIRFGPPDATMEEVYEAATAACLHDFVLTLPEGYDTQLGERGITLSGGQRQRLSLARALLINPRILILDDTTSALDPITAKEVWRRIKERRGNLDDVDRRAAPLLGPRRRPHLCVGTRRSRGVRSARGAGRKGRPLRQALEAAGRPVRRRDRSRAPAPAISPCEPSSTKSSRCCPIRMSSPRMANGTSWRSVRKTTRSVAKRTIVD